MCFYALFSSSCLKLRADIVGFFFRKLCGLSFFFDVFLCAYDIVGFFFPEIVRIFFLFRCFFMRFFRTLCVFWKNYGAFSSFFLGDIARSLFAIHFVSAASALFLFSFFFFGVFVIFFFFVSAVFAGGCRARGNCAFSSKIPRRQTPKTPRVFLLFLFCRAFFENSAGFYSF